MQPLNCLIIEDEPLAANVLKAYIETLPDLALAGICHDVFSATKTLHENKIDLLFVDINLPKVNGLDFIKSLNGNYQIILTTAYHQYALDGFNLNVVDYLLKPIELSRFMQAINKVFEKIKPSYSEEKIATDKRSFYFFNVDKKQVKIFADEILYIESLKDYVRIHTKDKRAVTKFQIGELEKHLNDSRFIRIHKSFIINSEKITSLSASEVELESFHIPIGRTYKNSLQGLTIFKK